MTNTQKLETATRPYIGQTLSSKAIRLITQDMFPGTPDGSLLVSDHSRVRNSEGTLERKPGQAATYADGLFEQVSLGYKVLADNEIQRKPTTRGMRGVSDAEVLARAKQLLASSAPSA